MAKLASSASQAGHRDRVATKVSLKGGKKLASRKVLGSRPGRSGRSLVGTRRKGLLRIGSAPSKEQVALQVEESTVALTRALENIKRPGVKPSVPHTIPIYSVDPDNPAILVRRIKGRVERGRMVKGQFVVG